jgi:hypothetical protein
VSHGDKDALVLFAAASHVSLGSCKDVTDPTDTRPSCRAINADPEGTLRVCNSVLVYRDHMCIAHFRQLPPDG